MILSIRISQRLIIANFLYVGLYKRGGGGGGVFDSLLPNYSFASLKILNFLNDHDTLEISVVKLASIEGAE